MERNILQLTVLVEVRFLSVTVFSCSIEWPSKSTKNKNKRCQMLNGQKLIQWPHSQNKSHYIFGVLSILSAEWEGSSHVMRIWLHHVPNMNVYTLPRHWLLRYLWEVLAAVMWGQGNPYLTIKLHPLRTYSKCNMALPCEEPAPCSVFISAAVDWCRSCVSCGDPVGCNGVCGL